MRILLSVGDRGKAGNYLMYLKDLGDVEIITPDSKIPDGDYDLLVLGGGEDIDPKLYGEEVRYENVEIERVRDDFEFELVERFLSRGKAIFGICRGFQLLTVFFGGTLYQDLEKEGFKPIHRGKNGEDVEHRVIFSGVFENYFGLEGIVNSNHHQGLKGFPEKLKGEILAVSEDHLVEAFYSKTYRVLGVQWHPERHDSPISKGILSFLKLI
jgi:putative glutamine amidotransferase